MSKRHILRERWLDTVDAWDRLTERTAHWWDALIKRIRPPHKK